MRPQYINRELSWLEFNKRVLEEAFNKKNPILERLKFLAISGSNLDEFIMVRVAGLKGQVDGKIYLEAIDGLMPKENLLQVINKTKKLINEQNRCWVDLLYDLKKNNIILINLDSLKNSERKWCKKHFISNIFPILTPLAVDLAHPFPFVPNLALCMALKLKNIKEKKVINVVIPLNKVTTKFIKIKNMNKFIKIEDLITLCINELFADYNLISYGTFRIIRDSDIEFSDEAEDLVKTYENQLKQRRYGSVVLIEIMSHMPRDLQDMILKSLKTSKKNVLFSKHIIDTSSILEIYNSSEKKLKWKEYKPRFPERIKDANNNYFAAIRKKDMIIHHPFESFEVVVQFLRQAAKDKKVLVIKQTIYRTAKENNAILEALVEAAEEGKSVTALLEIKARFDEEANIKVARYLQRYGVQVVYGSINLKTHAKVSLVVRKERKGLNTYVHFGTGNYHIITAKNYVDLSLFTNNENIAKDAQEFFNMATGYAKPKKWKAISVAPDNLRKNLIQLINEEINLKRSGKNGEIWIKCNSLVDEEVINALYKASQNGVSIELIIRGICCLKPKVKGLSENIQVKSIVGRFLEHGRIYCFSNGKEMPSRKAKVYIASSDIMPRNFDRRYEVMVPILNMTVHKQILDQIMVAYLNDKKQSWTMKKDGKYIRNNFDIKSISAHEYFMSNPSLSGRGGSIKYNKPKQILLKK